MRGHRARAGSVARDQPTPLGVGRGLLGLLEPAAAGAARTEAVAAAPRQAAIEGHGAVHVVVAAPAVGVLRRADVACNAALVVRRARAVDRGHVPNVADAVRRVAEHGA